MGERQHPWAELRARAHIRLGFNSLDGLRGIYARRGERAAILLERTLDQRQRRAVLAHELVHDERGGGCDVPGAPATWDAVVVRDELAVRREVAHWLVPRDQLLMFITRTATDEIEGVTALEVAEEFDVPEDVAMTALRLLAIQFDGWGEIVA